MLSTMSTMDGRRDIDVVTATQSVCYNTILIYNGIDKRLQPGLFGEYIRNPMHVLVVEMISEVDCRRGAHVNPDIFKLENKPKNILCHEIGAGSPCLKCNCPGLDLHYWRKMCKVCSCRMDDHDVILPRNMDHGQIVIGRLFDFIPEFESKLHLHPPSPSLPYSRKAYPVHNIKYEKIKPESMYNVKLEDAKEKNKMSEYTWVPTTDRVLAEKYFSTLPENERPIADTEGALDRRHKLLHQV
ncbi:unnamed protein product [Brugia timori]|uniref:PET domain-containing protein n=1 Tax=Brugia timori TaxID=42155 RepID=A0A0R3R0A8_9BILA|nr:unnamed protein product [Brugia timori]